MRSRRWWRRPITVSRKEESVTSRSTESSTRVVRISMNVWKYPRARMVSGTWRPTGETRQSWAVTKTDIIRDSASDGAASSLQNAEQERLAGAPAPVDDLPVRIAQQL